MPVVAWRDPFISVQLLDELDGFAVLLLSRHARRLVAWSLPSRPGVCQLGTKLNGAAFSLFVLACCIRTSAALCSRPSLVDALELSDGVVKKILALNRPTCPLHWRWCSVNADGFAASSPQSSWKNLDVSC